MTDILFVVHRYAPYPGGSEVNTQNMAEECQRRGHNVTVLTHEHKGDLNGVSVTSDYQGMLNKKWDLIIVHGGDVISQNVVHINADKIQSPVLYLLIKPSDSDICVEGLKKHRFLGYGTSMDVEHIKKFGMYEKARRIRYGIVQQNTIVSKNHVKNIRTTYVSAGGFWHHKAMTPLAKAFLDLDMIADLYLYGYGAPELAPKQEKNIQVLFGLPKEDVMNAIANADGYIMNSYEEGFGLVLLEAMMNKVPWFARDIAGAHDMRQFGTLYKDESELIEILRNYKRDERKIEDAYNYAMANHTIHDTVNDIEDVLLETLK